MRWMKPKEAAAYACVSPKVLYRAIAAGDLKAARVGRGRNLVVSESWVDEYLTRCARDPRVEGTL